MTLLLLLPPALMLLVLGAHFLRSATWPGVVASLALVVVLAIPRPWVARVVPVALVLGALEWVRTLVTLASFRAQHGLPAGRLVVILGAVALATAASALVFRTGRLRRRHGLARPGDG